MKKALRSLIGRLSLVDYVNEISNLDLLRDLVEVGDHLNIQHFKNYD